MASAFLIVVSAFPARSPMAARLKKLERVSEKSATQRLTIIDQIVTKERSRACSSGSSKPAGTASRRWRW